jgi:tetraacyldisaccharide 4'-kinase
MIRRRLERKKWPTPFAVSWFNLISGEARGVVPSLARFGLLLASYPYQLAMWGRNRLYDRGWKKITIAKVPVISVGNLTVGGTGKTPMVVFLAKWFRDRNLRVAILSRGYGAGADGRNDEARELETKLDDVPHLQNPDRVASSEIAVEELDMQVLLLDDGFQHRKLARSLDIVLLDATNPFGFGYCLPRGLLREGTKSMRRADLVVLTRCDQVSESQLTSIRKEFKTLARDVELVESRHRPTRLRNASGNSLEVDSARGKVCLAFCAIGNPIAFFATVRRLGAVLAETFTFPDHYEFTAGDLERIAEAIQQHPSVEMIFCTGKDLAKLHIDELAGVPLWAIDIELLINRGSEALETCLQRLVSSSN